ncbi:MAG: glyoxalase, partial [Gemmatimonadaceae bacterium]
HLGTNFWVGPDAAASPTDEARLLEWTILVPRVAELDTVAASLERAGYAVQREAAGASFRVPDPWGTVLRVHAA